MRVREQFGRVVGSARADGELRRASLGGVVAAMLWCGVVVFRSRDKDWAWLPASGLLFPGAVVLVMAGAWGRGNARHVALGLRAVVVTAIAIASLVAADDVPFAVSLLLACVGPALGIWAAEAVVHSRAERQEQQQARELQADLAGISSALEQQAAAIARERRRRRPRIAGHRRG